MNMLVSEWVTIMHAHKAHSHATQHAECMHASQEGKPVKVLIGTTKLAGGDKILESIAGMPVNGVRVAAAAAAKK